MDEGEGYRCESVRFWVRVDGTYVRVRFWVRVEGTAVEMKLYVKVDRTNMGVRVECTGVKVRL